MWLHERVSVVWTVESSSFLGINKNIFDYLHKYCQVPPTFSCLFLVPNLPFTSTSGILIDMF